MSLQWEGLADTTLTGQADLSDVLRTDHLHSLSAKICHLTLIIQNNMTDSNSEIVLNK